MDVAEQAETQVFSWLLLKFKTDNRNEKKLKKRNLIKKKQKQRTNERIRYCTKMSHLRTCKVHKSHSWPKSSGGALKDTDTTAIVLDNQCGLHVPHNSLWTLNTAAVSVGAAAGATAVSNDVDTVRFRWLAGTSKWRFLWHIALQRPNLFSLTNVFSAKVMKRTQCCSKGIKLGQKKMNEQKITKKN